MGVSAKTRSRFVFYRLLLLFLWGTPASFLFFHPAPACAKPLKVIVITDVAGLGDKGFNDVCWQGALRAQKDFGIKAGFLQAREQADYISSLTMVAGQADVVVTLGYLFVDAVKQVAPHFPNIRFVHIEGEIAAQNTACFDFKSEEGGFIAGLTAGLFTKTRKVGAVTGMEIPPVEAYAAGFQAGVRTAEKVRGEPIEAIVASAGSFNDPVKGKSLSQALMDKGVDVIFRAAGNTGVGVNEAVKNANGVFMIAEDLDMDAEMPGKVLVSALKRMDNAVYEAIRDVVQGSFKSGHRRLGVAEGGIGMSAMKHSRRLFSEDSLARIEKAYDLLKQGRLSVPGRYSELEKFRPPEL